MAIKYNVIQRGQPGVEGGGEKKYYATAVSQGETTIEDLTRLIEKISTVSGADIRAVLYALVDVVPEELADGKIVRMGDLGSFRVSLSSHGHETEEEVNSNSIRGSKVLFDPYKKFDQMLANLTYEKAS